MLRWGIFSRYASYSFVRCNGTLAQFLCLDVFADRRFCATLEMLQGEQSNARLALVNRYQRASINIGGEQVNRAHHCTADPVGPQSPGSRLYNARFLAVGNGENKTKIKIVGQNRKIMGLGVVKNRGVGRVRMAYR